MPIPAGEDLDQQAVAWFIRLRGDHVTADDWMLFNQWSSQSDAHRQAFNELCAMWEGPDLLKSLNQSDSETLISPQQKKHRFSVNVKILLALAACFALMIALHDQWQIWMSADFVSALGERKTIHLQDGTTVMLNTDSAIEVDMQDKLRKVMLLKGEAFFDVQPDKNRPFTVEAGHSNTNVLGTRFFVQREHGQDDVRVLSGRVEVAPLTSGSPPAALHDKNTVAIDDSGLRQTAQLASSLPVSWINGYLTFEEENLGDVIKQIYRYRHGFVVFANPELRNLKINGRLSLKEPADMLRVLQKTLDIKITILSDWLVVIG